MRVVVVGGGIAGLAAAWEASDRPGTEVTLLEAGHRLGGTLRTEHFAGKPVDLGPDAFLARRPEAVDLAKEVGLGDDLVPPATGSASVWLDGGLRRLPDGLLLGVPTDLRALARSGVVSRGGVARAALDIVLPGQAVLGNGDEAVGEVIRRRLGREVHEVLVDPLLSGINAGRSESLSLDAGVPQLAAALRGRRSVLAAAWRTARVARRTAKGEPPPVFLTVRGGLGRFADRLGKHLAERRVALLLGFEVGGIEPGPNGWLIAGPGGRTIEADAVVVAVPPRPAADLLTAAAPAAAGLRRLPLASVALTLLAYRPEAIGRPMDGSGFLVPRGTGRLVTAASFWNQKWPRSAPRDLAVLRVSAGRDGDDRAARLDDDALVERLHLEMAEALAISELPVDSGVVRWPDAFPQYRPGHAETVAGIQASLPEGIALAGNYLSGVGIPACIASGRTAAARVVQR